MPTSSRNLAALTLPRPAVTRLAQVWLLAAGALAAAPPPAGATGPAAAERPVAVAVRAVPRAPRIDGILDDEIWRTAPVIDDLRQREPVEGAPVSERTTFQVAYDDEALYVAIRCFDSDPAGIVARLTRRDGVTQADLVTVNLDPQHDRRSGHWFAVYASGSLADGAYYADRGEDAAWDAVWDARTTIDAAGWNAEFRIPYHALRFRRRDEYVWGLNIERRITRKKEMAYWPLVRKDQPGWVSQFGDLAGIAGIQPPAHLELLPYGMGQVQVDGGHERDSRAGLDVRYGLGSGTWLTATVNPDFGQVEADPAQLNLTAFEDYYSEQRPFFVEGAGIFQNNDYYLFYSRRIGRRPGYFRLPGDAVELERPGATSILGAVKVTGKTGGAAFGLLDAVTAAEHALVQRQVADGTVRQRVLVEPRTHYLVGRAEQRIRNETSRLGVFGSMVDRQKGASAWTGAADWDLTFHQNKYNLTGTLAGSSTERAGAEQRGYIAHLEFDKRTGWFQWETGAAGLSPGADLNDVGYLRRGDLAQAWASANLLRYDPWRQWRSFDIYASCQQEWDYDGLDLGSSLQLSFWGELRNFWDAHLHVGHDLSRYDDDDVRRGGPVIRRPGGSWMHVYVETDTRRMFRCSIRPEYQRYAHGRTWQRGLNLGAEMQPLPSMWFSFTPAYVQRLEDAQWFRLVTAGDGPHFLYGRLDRRTLDLTGRARMSFTPRLSLELYLQPFIAFGDYRQIKELVAPRTYRFQPYPWPQNPDFQTRSLRSNMVLRWEFLPGSTLFLVWSQARSAWLANATERDLELRPLDRLRSAFTDDGANILLAKVSYWVAR